MAPRGGGKGAGGGIGSPFTTGVFRGRAHSPSAEIQFGEMLSGGEIFSKPFRVAELKPLDELFLLLPGLGVDQNYENLVTV